MIENRLLIFTVLGILVLAVGGAAIIYKIKYTSPPDADGDGIADGLDLDDDNDGWADRQELSEGTNPKDEWSFPVDSDGDGLSDVYELKIAAAITRSLELAAAELNATIESVSWKDYMTGTYDPNNNDTNNDGIVDGKEDYDFDGLTNAEEQFYGTDPYNKDTDGDTLTDGDEVHYYYTNPLNRDTDSDVLRDNYDPIPDSSKPRNSVESVSGTDPELALRKIDTDCYKLSRTAQRDSCFDSLAQIYADPEYCKKIMDNTRKDSCLKSFGIEAQPLYQG